MAGKVRRATSSTGVFSFIAPSRQVSCRSVDESVDRLSRSPPTGDGRALALSSAPGGAVPSPWRVDRCVWQRGASWASAATCAPSASHPSSRSPASTPSPQPSRQRIRSRPPPNRRSRRRIPPQPRPPSQPTRPRRRPRPRPGPRHGRPGARHRRPGPVIVPAPVIVDPAPVVIDPAPVVADPAPTPAPIADPVPTPVPPATPVVTPAPVRVAPNYAVRVVRIALAQRGKRYVRGAAGPRAFDCSGLVRYAYLRAKVSGHLGGGHSARAMLPWARAHHLASRSHPRVGDVVIYGGGSHAGDLHRPWAGDQRAQLSAGDPDHQAPRAGSAVHGVHPHAHLAADQPRTPAAAIGHRQGFPAS